MLFFMVTGEAPPPVLPAPVPVDESLIARIGQNDMEAFDQLYRLTERPVHALVLSILRDPNDACDVVQETYLKVRAAAHLYRPQGKPLAWIFTIAKNLAHSHLRRQSRTDISDVPALEDDLRFSYVSDPTDRMVLTSALKILGEEEREILLLHAVSGFLHREIASALGLPLSTVLSRYHRALKKLKTFLTGTEVSL